MQVVTPVPSDELNLTYTVDCMLTHKTPKTLWLSGGLFKLSFTKVRDSTSEPYFLHFLNFIVFLSLMILIFNKPHKFCNTFKHMLLRRFTENTRFLRKCLNKRGSHASL